VGKGDDDDDDEVSFFYWYFVVSDSIKKILHSELQTSTHPR
jgi:hypothetical protein